VQATPLALLCFCRFVPRFFLRWLRVTLLPALFPSLSSVQKRSGTDLDAFAERNQSETEGNEGNKEEGVGCVRLARFQSQTLECR
jgi:hypothetical protein